MAVTTSRVCIDYKRLWYTKYSVFIVKTMLIIATFRRRPDFSYVIRNTFFKLRPSQWIKLRQKC